MGLTFIGFIFLWVGVATLSFQPLQAMAYFITSLVTLGPGSYVCFYLFQAMKGHPDYPIASIPSFDD
ncbi:hypothetical protein HMI54_001479 [Coelomomyces lativittatus]|nr:hypothetical protein HMI54_001479 [Coelomomyces lativittatus]